MALSAGQQLIALPPPPPATDLIQSALFLPLSAITRLHRGKKIRTIGQIILFDAQSSMILLRAPAVSPGTAPRPTILINASIPLLGRSPAAKDVSQVEPGVYSRQTAVFAPREPSSVPVIDRERLRIERGEWVNVVGWLEGKMPRRARLKGDDTFSAPLNVVLEAIHLSSARPPPEDAVYRGQITPWDGTLQARNAVDRSPEHKHP